MALLGVSTRARQHVTRWFGWRGKGLLLLGQGRGVGINSRRCCLCGRTFGRPRRDGSKFHCALPLVEPDTISPILNDGATVFVGRKLLVATVDPRLQLLLGRRTAFIGEKVLVAKAKAADGEHTSYLLCRSCGSYVVEKAGGINACYTWDWLAEFRRRWFLGFGSGVPKRLLGESADKMRR